MVRFRGVVAGVVLALAVPVQTLSAEADAEVVSPGGPYVGLIGGAAFVEDLEGRVRGADVSGRFETGWAASAVAGTRVGESPVRVEVEIGYLSADADDIDVEGGTVTDVGGKVHTVAVMFNGYVDLPLTDALAAYAGVGVGLAYTDIDAGGDVVGAGTIVADSDGDSDFVWQARAGAALELRENVTLTVGYRLCDIGLANNTLVHLAELGVRFGF
ncbi:MAG: outer membrane protein [Planctomycetota bacterium]